MDTVTVLTDFGAKDPYVGVMKGVMLAINPRLSVIDITHEVEAQDVREACFLIGEYYPYFPEGTVHLCVVDPTVGSARKPLVVVKDGHSFVGPDNGLFSLLFAAGDASAIFSGLDFPGGDTAVVIDPPRRGCDEAFLRQLFQFRPRAVVYVSCDPATQMRDLKGFIAAGYQLRAVQPFDLFPPTRHLECVVTLSLD